MTSHAHGTLSGSVTEPDNGNDSDGGTTPATDPTMDEIVRAVELGRSGEPEPARRALTEIWDRIGVAGDAFHRCTLAHYFADLVEDPAESLMWNVRALDAADALSDDRAQDYHADLRAAGFYPSLHLNLAEDFRRLGSFGAADAQLKRAHDRLSDLPDGPYGDMIRDGVSRVGKAVAHSDRT